MNGNKKGCRAFTLVELLTILAILGVLAALALPVLSRARESGRRIVCVGNLRQVNLAIRLYADDFSDKLPVLPEPNPFPNGVGAYYKQLVKGYLGLTGEVSPDEKAFICPSDRSIHMQVSHAFTSYTFNGYETDSKSIPRINGRRLSSIQNPSKAALAGEWPAFFGGSWHPYAGRAYRDAKNVMSFVDGRVDFIKIYWDGVAESEPRNYEPPAGYDYSWDGE